MDFVRLTPEQRLTMDEDGFLVVRAALDRETVARAIDAVDRLAHSFLNKPVVLDRPEYNQLDLRPGLLRDEALFRAGVQFVDRPPRGSIDGPQYSSPFHSDYLQKARESELAGFSSRVASGYSNCSRSGTRGAAAGRHQNLLLSDRFSLDSMRDDPDGPQDAFEGGASGHPQGGGGSERRGGLRFATRRRATRCSSKTESSTPRRRI